MVYDLIAVNRQLTNTDEVYLIIVIKPFDVIEVCKLTGRRYWSDFV